MENVKNEIVKASVKNDRLEVTFKEMFIDANFSNEVTKKCSQIVHSDLRAAFDKLKPHLVMVCEQKEAFTLLAVNDINDYDITQLENYIITGFSIGGTDESAGVTIIGQKLLKSGQVLNLISPFVKFEDIEAYEFAGELYNDIKLCDWEIEEYLFGEKWGIKQMEFDFDTPESSDAGSEGNTGKKAKKSRKAKETVETFDNE